MSKKSWTVKMDAVITSETSVTIYLSTQGRPPDNVNCHVTCNQIHKRRLACILSAIA